MDEPGAGLNAVASGDDTFGVCVHAIRIASTLRAVLLIVDPWCGVVMSDSPDGLSLVSVTDTEFLEPSRLGIPRLSVLPQLLPMLPQTGRKAPGRVDVPAATAALHWLTASTEPEVVFQHLSQLCVPIVCDIATVTMLDNASSASPPTVPTPAVNPTPDENRAKGRRRGGVPRKRATVRVRLPGVGGSASDDYTAVMTLTWLDGYQPSPTDVAVVKLLGRCAANLVHQSREAERHRLDQHHIAELESTLADRRIAATAEAVLQQTIGAAIGLLMATRRVSHLEAATLLDTTSRALGRDQAELAAAVLSTGRLP